MHSTFLRFCQFKSLCEIGPAFSGLSFSYPGNLVPHFPVVSVGLWSIWSLIGPSFSGPAFSVDTHISVTRPKFMYSFSRWYEVRHGVSSHCNCSAYLLIIDLNHIICKVSLSFPSCIHFNSTPLLFSQLTSWPQIAVLTSDNRQQCRITRHHRGSTG